MTGGKKIKMVKHLITWTFWYTEENNNKREFLFELSLQSCNPPCGRSPKKSLAFLTLRLCHQVWYSAQMYEDAALSRPAFHVDKEKQGTVKKQSHRPL